MMHVPVLGLIENMSYLNVLIVMKTVLFGRANVEIGTEI